MKPPSKISRSATDHYTLAVLSVVLGVGYSCFQANIVQFGVDQLTDKLIAFINWYTFLFVGSQSVAYVIFSLTNKYQSLMALLLSVSTSVIVASNFLFKNVLIKEPVTRNPFKLIYNVLKYALKTKYPRQRSAFTYCVDVFLKCIVIISRSNGSIIIVLRHLQRDLYYYCWRFDIQCY